MYFFIVRELRRNITLIIDPIDDFPNFLWPQFLDNSLYEIKTIDLPGSTRGSSRVRSIGQFISLTFVRYRGARLAYYFRRFRCWIIFSLVISVGFNRAGNFHFWRWWWWRWWRTSYSPGARVPKKCTSICKRFEGISLFVVSRRVRKVTSDTMPPPKRPVQL